MRTTNSCQSYTDEPVPDQVLHRAVERARFAPTGGNRGPVRFLFVRDPALKRILGQWYLEAQQKLAGPAWTDPGGFATRFGQHPVIIVVCADLTRVIPTDTALGRLSIVGGASVYPMVQNLCLALRDQGVGTRLTTVLVAREPEVKQLLGIPEQFSTACHVAAGYPARPFPRRLTRPEVAELAYTDQFGRPFAT
jgi:nitroreductase